MKLVHYSKIPSLKEIHPDHMGTGTRSEENKQGIPEIKRSFWYQHGTEPEALVTQNAKSVYTTTLHPHIQLYDLAKDSQGLIPKLREEANKRTVNPGVVTGEDYIKAIKDAGFHGYHNSESGNMSNVVALFHPQAVHSEEHVTPEHFQSFGKSEHLEIIFNIDDEDASTLHKAAPVKVGEVHPNQPWQSVLHPSGQIMWHANPEQAAKIDQHLSNPEQVQGFLNTIPQSHRALMGAIVNSTIKDPNRHFIPTEENGRQKLRARHIKSLIYGNPDIKIDTSQPNRIEISRSSHSQERPGQTLTLAYEGVPHVRKSEENVGRGPKRDLRSLHVGNDVERVLQPRRSILYFEQSGQFYAEDNRDLSREDYAGLTKSESRPVSKNDLSSPHFIFTTENPVYPASIKMTLPEAVNSLRKHGEDVVEIQGQYGQPERSLLIRNPKNVPALMDLAHQTGQESVIESNGVHHKMHYLNGPSAGQYKRGTGTQWFTSAPKDNYSSISTEYGVRHFKHNFEDGLFQKAEHRLDNLRKAVEPKLWASMANKHKAGVSDSSPDHEAQFRDFPHPKDYVKQVLDSKAEVPRVPGYGGSAHKMIHKVKTPKGVKMFMAKPYHQKSSISNMNTTGWSTLATNDLFRAGGIPDLAEKVTGYVHNGVPLTVHEFDNDKQSLYDLDSNGISNIKAHGPDILKIAAIDFLTHNKDRHGANLVAAMPEGDGLSKIKAIDHELNFKYDGGSSHYHPREFADSIGFDMINGGKKPHSRTIKDWWNKHSDQILNTFHKHLQHLKDPEMRDYFKENFEARHKFLTDHLNNENNRDSIFSREHEAQHKGVPSRGYWDFLKEREKK